MHPVLLLGAGKIGTAIAHFLANTGDYDVLVGDVDDRALERASLNGRVKTIHLDSSNLHDLNRAMKGRQSVLSALSYALNQNVARTALTNGLSYFDLTEDVQTTKTVREISQRARPGQIFVPQCGLAPGFVSIVAHHLTVGFEKLDEVELRVGALPQFPTNEMKYNLTWSTDGLINEYGNPCEAIHDGKLIEVLPLEGLEHFSLDGVDYEAFNTSGGVGTLAETLEGKVRTLNYKTVRYRGHRDLMHFLMNELRLNHRRHILKDILENSVPVTPQDVVLIFCTVTGWKDGMLTQVTDARKIYAGDFMGERCSAIQITTAAGICAVLDLHVTGKLPTQGFVRQEQVHLNDFLANRFGAVYDVQTRPMMKSVTPARV
ncbi:MAG TPA: saccharopine dehydrogenase C-terminal domain-containing protein [Tepidisphaeraceae bacterium]|jgi:saccharopine dehydrogenase-like NADP-dependent oxidoreductase|nr:saccharopine dehydrogenase C-terminal domain-containing protein [Tepidisphaeraceae bacterium]